MFVPYLRIVLTLALFAGATAPSRAQIPAVPDDKLAGSRLVSVAL